MATFTATANTAVKVTSTSATTNGKRRKHIIRPEAESIGGGADSASLYRLLAWLSPSYPIGAYSYSHGLEWCVETGDVGDRQSLESWLDGVLRHGSGHGDAVLLSHAWRAATIEDLAALVELAELAAALNPSAERKLESLAQGRAFLDATRSAWPHPLLDRLAEVVAMPALPVSVGVAAALHRVELDDVLVAYLHAFVANLISAGVRLIPLGQTDGQLLIATFEQPIVETARRARDGAIAGSAGCAIRAAITSMQHETQTTRLFRS